MNKTFIIAELSANHNHDKQVALDTIRAAKRCGADAVKIQTYTADTMTIDSNQEWFKIHGTIWNGENLYHLYQKAYMGHRTKRILRVGRKRRQTY